MRKGLLIVLALLLSVSLVAQERAGHIVGKVVDVDGTPLGGVSVTLTGMFTAPVSTVSTAEGTFRFLSLPPARDYTIKLELPGFKTKIEQNIIVVVGQTSNLTLTMEVGGLEEEITVTATTPVVDAKKTTVGVNITHEALQSLPSARDPWVFLRQVPGVVMDREDVGGTDTGMQSGFLGRGARSGGQNQWNVDGVNVGDPAAIGASITYYDFDAFEEMQVSTGGSDVTTQTGGIALNLVTRRGGNRISLGGRFYVTDGRFQATNITDELKAQGLQGTNKIRRIEDYGVNVGFPIIKDKVWFWGSFGVQDIKSNTIIGGPWDMLLTNYAAKLNFQLIPQNRFEAFIHSGNKEMWGRSSTLENPEGLYQGTKYHFGTPVIKIQDEHMFGNDMFLALKYGYIGGGFHLTPMSDMNFEKQAIWDVTAQRYYGSQASRYWVSRPQHQFTFTLDYFKDKLFGVGHDIKLGVEFNMRSALTQSVWSGNYILYRKFNYPIIDFNLDGITNEIPPANFYRIDYWRGYYEDLAATQYAAFIRDTISFGRFNIMIGLRYDQQIPSVRAMAMPAVDRSKPWTDYFTTATIDALDRLLPAAQHGDRKAVAKDGSAYSWKTFSPRLGVTWDITGDGKTLAKLSLGQYGDFMGVGEAWRWKPGGTGGWIDVFWWDTNDDGKVHFNELYWASYRTAPVNQLYRIFNDAGSFIATAAQKTDARGQYWGGFEIDNPGLLTDPYRVIDKNAQSPRTTEAILTLEREIFANAAIQLHTTYRKYDRFNWARKWFPATGVIDHKDLYISWGKPPATLPTIGSLKNAANYDYYYASTTLTAASDWSWEQRMPKDRYDTFLGVDFVFVKRLANKWMFDFSASLQKQAAYYGANGYTNPNNLWAYEGRTYSPLVGAAAGKISQNAFASWMVKFSGMYQLPYDINITATFNAREGFIVREFLSFVNYTIPNPASRTHTIDLTPFDSETLPVMYNLAVRLEKVIRAGDFGRIYLMADAFNALNAKMVIRRYQRQWGTYHWYGEGNASNRFVPFANYFKINEILNPMVLRLGIRFSY